MNPKSPNCWLTALASDGMIFWRAAESFLPAFKISRPSFSSAGVQPGEFRVTAFERLQFPLRFLAGLNDLRD